jgi:hypothetical protein
VLRTTICTISSILLAAVLHAECVLMPPVEASRHVRIQARLDGRPLGGAMVIVRPSHVCTCATDMLRGNPLDTTMLRATALQATDKNGIADLPEFAPGDYDIAVTLNGVASTAFIGLHVLDKTGVTTLPMDLTEQVRRVEEVPLRDRVEAFRGTVRDITGVPLPGANMVVVKRGSNGKDVVLTAKADPDGHFSGQLGEGFYIAIFFSSGFRPAIEPFEVAKTGVRELPVRLNVGSCP